MAFPPKNPPIPPANQIRSLQDKAPIKRAGLKITNEKSSLPPPKPDTTAEFNKDADQAFSRDQDYKKRGFELFTKFKSMVNDKILPENKSLLSKDIEDEVVNKLIILASELNEDENKLEGEGSIVLSTLLMKMMLAQRDVINVMAYKIERLEKELYKQVNTEPAK